MTWENYYQILSSSREVEEVENPKKDLIKYHTDKVGDDKEKEELYKKKTFAWSLLGDKNKRIVYDYSTEEKWEELKKQHGDCLDRFPIKSIDINCINEEKKAQWEKEQMLQLVRRSFLYILCWLSDDTLKKLIQRYYSPSEEPKMTVEELKKEAWSRLENHPNKDEIKAAIETEKKIEEKKEEERRERERKEKDEKERQKQLMESKKKVNSTEGKQKTKQEQPKQIKTAILSQEEENDKEKKLKNKALLLFKKIEEKYNKLQLKIRTLTKDKEQKALANFINKEIITKFRSLVNKEERKKLIQEIEKITSKCKQNTEIEIENLKKEISDYIKNNFLKKQTDRLQQSLLANSFKQKAENNNETMKKIIDELYLEGWVNELRTSYTEYAVEQEKFWAYLYNKDNMQKESIRPKKTEEVQNPRKKATSEPNCKSTDTAEKKKESMQEQKKTSLHQDSQVKKIKSTSSQIPSHYLQEKKEQKILNGNKGKNNNDKFKSNYNTYTIILILITITMNIALLTTFFPSIWIKKIIVYWLFNFNSKKRKSIKLN